MVIAFNLMHYLLIIFNFLIDYKNKISLRVKEKRKKKAKLNL